MRSNARNCWPGAGRADIRGIHRRTGPISGICVFSSRRRVLSIVITSATAGSAWIIFRASLLAVFATHIGTDVCMVRAAESLSRAGENAGRKSFAA